MNRWCAAWITAGFDAIEALLAADTRRGDFCFGDAPTLADVYLAPQVESARRFKVDMGRWPLISGVDAACHRLAAFRDAAPAAQPDAGNAGAAAAQRHAARQSVRCGGALRGDA